MRWHAARNQNNGTLSAISPQPTNTPANCKNHNFIHLLAKQKADEDFEHKHTIAVSHEFLTLFAFAQNQIGEEKKTEKKSHNTHKRYNNMSSEGIQTKTL